MNCFYDILADAWKEQIFNESYVRNKCITKKLQNVPNCIYVTLNLNCFLELWSQNIFKYGIEFCKHNEMSRIM